MAKKRIIGYDPVWEEAPYIRSWVGVVGEFVPADIQLSEKYSVGYFTVDGVETFLVGVELEDAF